jgi:hypothetical protein
MSVNRFKPHLYVIPEDDRDRQIANGFVQYSRVSAQAQVVEPAGGWARVLDTFKREYVPLLSGNRMAHVVLLIDFDGEYPERFKSFQDQIPLGMRDRVFVVGPRQTPEALKQVLSMGYEAVGRALAQECDSGAAQVWGHPDLEHNHAERLRLVEVVKPFLMP